MMRRFLGALALALPLALTVAIVAVPAAAGAASWQEQAGETEKIDINKAGEEELQRLPGIGPAMARRIVEWRSEHGPFERVDDLLDIRGIGARTLDKLRPFIVVGDEESEEG